MRRFDKTRWVVTSKYVDFYQDKTLWVCESTTLCWLNFTGKIESVVMSALNNVFERCNVAVVNIHGSFLCQIWRQGEGINEIEGCNDWYHDGNRPRYT